MEVAGWTFNERDAQDLYTRLVARRDEVEKGLIARYGSWPKLVKEFVAKRDDKKLGRKKGELIKVYKTEVFNPGSRQHCIKVLKEAGWKPTAFTEGGQAKLDEEILESLDVPEAKDMVEYLLIQKRIGQLGDGDNGWLKLVKHGRIHASYNPMGTVTGRASHMRPNIAQVPKVGSPYGEECRALFTVPKGWTLLGADFEGLELRCLAHYMAHYDDGAYAAIVTGGDVHMANKIAAGLPTRDNAKTFIYAFLYGAGDEKIGRIIGKGPGAGRRLKEKFLEGLPALGKLRNGIHKIVSGKQINGVTVIPGRSWIKGLDGRRIPVRSPHAALNSLLQACGAILCKRWLVDVHDKLLQEGLRWGWDGDFVILGWIHDEIQIAVRDGLESSVGPLVVACAEQAGTPYGFKCRLNSKYVTGKSWKDTH
jgi:DNA polymerase I-like protein with 3'-5' exonuclease and polymerase domains